MKKEENYKGILNTYIKWPLYLSALMVAMLMSVVLYREQAKLIVAGFTVVYCIIALLLFNINKQELLISLMDYATNYGNVQKEMLRAFDVPYAIFDEVGVIIWYNEAFDAMFKVEGTFRWSIVGETTGITREQLPAGEEPVEYKFTLNDKDLRCRARRISLIYEKNRLIDPESFNGSVITLLVYDDTEINTLKRLNRESGMVAGYIYLDNYDEIMEHEEDVRMGLLLANVNNAINRYVLKHKGIVKKTDPDKYFVVMKQVGFDEMLEAKFDLLQTIKGSSYGMKELSTGKEIIPCLSMGFGVGGGDFEKSAVYAKAAIDMAVSRGGDQAAVKDEKDLKCYGGSTDHGTTTKVFARRVAQIITDHINNYSQVIVMGHTMADQDAFGACIGIHSICHELGKKCYVVVNQITSSIRPLVSTFSFEYEDDNYFVSPEEAAELTSPETLLVVVDTNKPDLCDSPQLLELCKAVIVIDHHRQGSERIENPLYQYIESNASSACEMISELLQYVKDGVRLKNNEADCLYAGIMIDSGNFTTKTSARTFEAAAYLRKNGADVTRIRKMFRDSMESYKARAEAVRSAELFENEFAIAVCPTEGLDSPTVVGAQAANELMNIKGVKASFVLTDYQEKIFISARSIDEINVQLVMERMGGGGHLNIAGVQLRGHTVESAKQELKDTLLRMLEKNEI